MLQRYFVKSYRNLRESTIPFEPKRSVFVWGDNNQGKTNFLESLFMVINGESPIQNDRTLLIQSESKESIIGIEFFEQGQMNQLYVKLMLDGGRFITLNKQVIRSFSNISKWLRCYFLSADVIRLFQDSPEGRRKVLDQCCSEQDKTYQSSLKQYKRIIRQKNNALKTQSDPILIETLNKQLIPYADHLVSVRKNIVQQLIPILLNRVRESLSFEVLDLNIKYVPKRIQWDENDCYIDCLQKQWNEDLEKEYCIGYTLSGPHRDDFEIDVNGKSLFLYYSRGINRIISILFNMAIIALKEPDSMPIVLLDDAFSEIDNTHKKYLIQGIEKKAHVFYTTVLKSDQQFFEDPVVYHIKQGQLLREK